MQKKNRIGERRKNKNGSSMVIIKYKNANDIMVEFENGYKVKTQYGNFERGSVSNVYDAISFGVGYIGEGKYKARDKNGKISKHYKYWNHMLERCYSENVKKKRPTYNDKTVCEEWHNFQTFAKWFDENYYEIGDGDKMCLDKDILKKGNKVYSQETCVFVPNRINNMFLRSQNIRGEYPIGVIYHKNKFEWQCNTINKRKYSTSYKTPEEAFYKYKEFKEKYIKEVADEYKDKIPTKLYEAMYRYEVEITD